jgi:2-C-methyl-D-erythritol 2,4-cyclodiphosphate synthase
MCQKGIQDSAEYLKVLLRDLKDRKLTVSNISISLEGARPKIEPIADQMKTNISELLSVPKERIGITATSGEELTSFGKGEGIKCMCVAVLIPRS